MALKIKATSYYEKNLELYSKNYLRTHLNITAKGRKPLSSQSRYVLLNEIRIQLKCKSNFTGDILNEIDTHGFTIESYDNSNIYCKRSFKEVIIMEWREFKQFADEVLSHNVYLVHNEMRGIRKKFMKEIFWYEIYENNVKITLDDIIQQSPQKKLK